MPFACRYFKDPNLNVENMATVSKAGKGLLVWVTAITKYYDVAKNVEPLRIKVGSRLVGVVGGEGVAWGGCVTKKPPMRLPMSVMPT